MAFILPSWFLYRVLIFHIEGKALLIRTLLEQTIPFCIDIACMIFLLFIIAKGLAMCRLGGVIISQIVLFQALVIAGFKHFLCTNLFK